MFESQQKRPFSSTYARTVISEPEVDNREWKAKKLPVNLWVSIQKREVQIVWADEKSPSDQLYIVLNCDGTWIMLENTVDREIHIVNLDEISRIKLIRRSPKAIDGNNAEL